MNIELAGNMKLHNKFEFILTDAETGEVKQKAYAENIVLNNFLNHIVSFSSNKLGYIHLGTGTGTPIPTRTSLFTFGFAGGAVTTDKVLSPTSASITKKMTLQPTDGVGLSFTEVGFSNNSSNGGLETHAIIKDSGGNPISIPKNATDILTVYATVYFQLGTIDPSLADFVEWIPCDKNILTNTILGTEMGAGGTGTWGYDISYHTAKGRPTAGNTFKPSASIGSTYGGSADTTNFIFTVTSTAAVGSCNGPIQSMVIGGGWGAFVIHLPAAGIFEQYSIAGESPTKLKTIPGAYTTRWDKKPGTTLVVKKNGVALTPGTDYTEYEQVWLRSAPRGSYSYLRSGDNNVVLGNYMLLPNRDAFLMATGQSSYYWNVLTVDDDGGISEKRIQFPAQDLISGTDPSIAVAHPVLDALFYATGSYPNYTYKMADVNYDTGVMGTQWTIGDALKNMAYPYFSFARFTPDGKYFIVRSGSTGYTTNFKWYVFDVDPVGKTIANTLVSSWDMGTNGYSPKDWIFDVPNNCFYILGADYNDYMTKFKMDFATGIISGTVAMNNLYDINLNSGITVRDRTDAGFKNFDTATDTTSASYTKLYGPTLTYDSYFGGPWSMVWSADGLTGILLYAVASNGAALLTFDKVAKTYEVVPKYGADIVPTYPFGIAPGAKLVRKLFKGKYWVSMNGSPNSSYAHGEIRVMETNIQDPGVKPFAFQLNQVPLDSDAITVDYVTECIPKSINNTLTVTAKVQLGGM